MAANDREPPNRSAAWHQAGRTALERLARLAVRLGSAPAACVWLVGQEEGRPVGCAGPLEAWTAAGTLPRLRRLCEPVVRTGKPLVLADARVHPVAVGGPGDDDPGPVACLGIPLLAGSGECAAVLCLVDHRPRQWALEEVDALRELAAATAAEIELRVRAAGAAAAERRPRESERRLRLLVESVPYYVITMLDLDGRVVDWNPGAERVTGYRAEEILGRPHSVFFPPEAVAAGAPERALRQAVDRGHHEDEGWRARKDGSRFWASVLVTALRDEDGGLIGYAEITRDLTERKRKEDEHRRRGELARLLQVAAVAANEAVQVEDALRTVLTEVCAYTGWPVGHVQWVDATGESGTVPAGLWHLADAERFEPFRQVTGRCRFRAGEGLPGRVLATGGAAWVEDVTELKDAPRSDVARRVGLRAGIAFPVLAGTEVLAVLEFFSERALERDELLLEAMANIGTQLGRAVERRRAAEELRAARDEAERANRAKSEFLSRMSHELRTPLNAILGFGQLLEADVRSDDDRESVEQIMRAGRHLLSLIDEVLDLAKIEAGRINLSIEPVSLGEVVRESLELIRPVAAQYGVELTGSAASAESTFVLSDLQRLKQVLLNLVSNAIKYNHPGGRVSVSCEAQPGGRVRVYVRDTGQGIPADKLDRLFTPFDRLGAEERGEVPGTGLGLALSKGLVQAMGGSIGVSSTPGEGSAFWVEIPTTADPTPMLAEAAPEEARPTALDIPGARVVLYIEDNLSNLRLVERILSRETRIRLVPAMQGRLGLELAREHHPDLILLDLDLPDVRGDRVLEHLKADPHLREVPVVVISADATTGQVERLQAAGARDYLTKPLDVRRFLEVVRETLTPGAATADSDGA